MQPHEYDDLGALTLDANTSLDGHVHDLEYEAELADVRARAEAPSTVVLVAVDGDGTLLGGVTEVVDHTSPFAEGTPVDAAAIRMLAVSRAAQRRGAGEALVRACIDRARERGKAAVVLHTTPWMTTAHRLYERIGFVRYPAHDVQITAEVLLLGYRLELVP
ncbi:MAG TPA: GNAT family N-acetyltransferase [Acidimicrobiales bacterium]